MDPRREGQERSALGVVGIDAEEERLYRWALLAPTLDVWEVCLALDLTPARAVALLGSLEAKGLLTRTGAGDRCLVPEPPDVAIERLILRRRVELERAHAEAADLAVRFRQPAPSLLPEAPVEVAAGPSAVRRQLAELAGAATEELLFLSPGGEGWPVPDSTPLVPRDERVRRRVIYDRDALGDARLQARLSGSAPDAVEARCAGDVPVTLMVADRRAAVVSLRAREPASLPGAALVRPSALLDALVALFDLLWSRAVPLVSGRAAPGGPLSPEDSRLLSLVLAGMTDHGMARQLGCSVRTVQRRIGRLMSRWGASTRPQLVWRAAREGWTGDG